MSYRVLRLSTDSSVSIVAVIVPVVVAANNFALVTLIVPLSTVRFWSVSDIKPLLSLVRSVVNAASSPVLIVAPELREKTVAPVSDVDLPVAVLACAIAPFKSAMLIVLSLTVAVARDANEFAENWLATLALFPAVNNVFSSEAVPVRAVTESAVIVPVV